MFYRHIIVVSFVICNHQNHHSRQKEVMMPDVYLLLVGMGVVRGIVVSSGLDLATPIL
jgi:hypothetical protein